MAMFWYGSDLHLDNYVIDRKNKLYNYPILPKRIGKDDMLILAGDICEYLYIDNYKNYFESLSKVFKKVFIVEGNHEFYENDISYEPHAIYPENFILLKNESYEVDQDTVIYGGTLWSNIADLSSSDRANIEMMISDFHIIKDGNEKYSIEKMTSLYNHFIEGLYEAQIKYPDKKLLVVSHFAPSMQSVTPRFKGNALNPYFCNNLDALIEKSNIEAWFHGHIHSVHDYTIGKTRILCNPRGYPREIDGPYTFKLLQL